jgi:inner membrane protein
MDDVRGARFSFINWIKTSITLKMMMIGGLVLLLLVPSAMIRSLIMERKVRQSEVIGEINGKWGLSQTIAGPVLAIKYYEYFKNDKNEVNRVVKEACFLPNDLSIEGTILPEVRYRGIYKSVLYSASVKMTGSFSTPDFSRLGVAQGDVLWNEAYLSFGISDLRGVRDSIPVRWNGRSGQAESGIHSTGIFASGVNTCLGGETPWKPDEVKPFSVTLNLNGSSDLLFIPVGKKTVARLKSSWSTPSFIGGFLPFERDVSADGFTAKWKVLDLNRSIPQEWTSANAPGLIQPKTTLQSWEKEPDDNFAVFGVSLLQPVDHYKKVERSVKYAVLFISLSFLTFLIIELVRKDRLHPMQYLLIGFAISLFYLLLLSLSEQLRFGLAYAISAGAVISMIAVYTHATLKSLRISLLIGTLLTALYAYLYVLLQLEDYALLMGSVGLFVILGTVMYTTRRIDWSGHVAACPDPKSDRPSTLR